MLVHTPTRYEQALYSNLAALPSRLTVEFELRVAEGAFCHSFHLSDMELAALVRTPEQVRSKSGCRGFDCEVVESEIFVAERYAAWVELDWQEGDLAMIAAFSCWTFRAVSMVHIQG